MSANYLLALIAAAIGGACISAQAPINARLAGHLGGTVTAVTVSFLVGFLVLAALTLLRGGVPTLAQAASAPWWAWVGGAVGALYVWSAAWSVGTLGVVTLVAALVFGQLLAALALDAVGAFGMAVREISWTRIAAVGLVGAGLVLSRL
jgi:bacterial/archaeal transporter family-2 protein